MNRPGVESIAPDTFLETWSTAEGLLLVDRIRSSKKILAKELELKWTCEKDFHHSGVKLKVAELGIGTVTDNKGYDNHV